MDFVDARPYGQVTWTLIGSRMRVLPRVRGDIECHLSQISRAVAFLSRCLQQHEGCELLEYRLAAQSHTDRWSVVSDIENDCKLICHQLNVPLDREP